LLFYRSSIAHQTLIKRSSISQPGPSLLFFFPLFLSISLGRSSIAHLSLIYRSAISLLLVLLIIESLQTRWMAQPDGSAVQALCLAAFRHGRLHSSQLAFASAGRCTAALLGQRTVIQIVDFWVQVVLFAFDSVSFGTRQTLSKSPRRLNTIEWLPVCDRFMGQSHDRWPALVDFIQLGNRLAVCCLESHSQRFNYKKEKRKRKALPKFCDGNVVDHMHL
jgi:hypothetical protein